MTPWQQAEIEHAIKVERGPHESTELVAALRKATDSNAGAWQLIFDLLRAHDLYVMMPVKDRVELTAATNAIRDAAKSRGYVAPVQNANMRRVGSGSAQREGMR